MVALAVMLAGCSPPGTHALLKGKQLLDEGDYADAVDELKSATEVMTTNAEAWDYLGVAEQHAGQAQDAANSYERALELDRDLTEAHYNLGCLWLEQNRPDDAVSEFTAYTLRRVNEPEGWLKLGVAQLREHQILPAEKSFSTALYLSPNNAEALNGLGLARMQRQRPEDAAKFFQAAVQNHSDYAPAILNFATVEHEYLRNDRMALDEYRAYLALNPRPADWDDVNALVNTLEESATTSAAPPTQYQQNQQSPPPQQNTYTEQQQESQPQPSAQESQPEQYTEQPPRQTYASPREQTEMAQETVRVQPEPIINSTPTTATYRPVQEPEMFASVQPTPPPSGPNLNPFHWFRSSPQPSPAPQEQQQVRVTPLPPPESYSLYQAPRPVHLVQPAPPTFPRYLYLSPPKPRAGDRRAATVMFEQARDLEMQNKFTDALDAYRRATRLDPAWFEAQYNSGVLAYRLRDFQFSLAAYEMALAIRPESENARYNFALALRASDYVTDAVNELKRLVELHPDNVRGHLELGNIYAQQLYDIPHARAEYLKVLQLDPGNSQASNIQFWLSANPQ